MWLIRVDPQVQKYSLSIVRGNPEKLSVFRVSSAKAWKEIFLDRWRRGKGFKAAVALVLAFIKTTYRNGLGTALNGFWFSDKRLVGSYDEWLLRYDQDFEDEKVKYFIGQLLTKPMISIIMPTFDSDINYLQKAIDSVFNQSMKTGSSA